MNWFRVQVVAESGMEIGVVRDSDGVLTLIVRASGNEWPGGVEPVGGVRRIRKCETMYRVEYDPYSPFPQEDVE
jgi:hypothetical protein